MLECCGCNLPVPTGSISLIEGMKAFPDLEPQNVFGVSVVKMWHETRQVIQHCQCCVRPGRVLCQNKESTACPRRRFLL